MECGVKKKVTKMELKAILCVLTLSLLLAPVVADKVDDQIAALKDPAASWEERTAALSYLCKCNDSRAVDPLIECLEDENSVIGFSAAVGLGTLGDPRAVDPLIKFMLNSNQDIDILSRQGAAYALGRIGDPKALPALKNVAANDESPTVRATAAESIEQIKAANPGEPEESPSPVLMVVISTITAILFMRFKRARAGR